MVWGVIGMAWWKVLGWWWSRDWPRPRHSRTISQNQHEPRLICVRKNEYKTGRSPARGSTINYPAHLCVRVHCANRSNFAQSLQCVPSRPNFAQFDDCVITSYPPCPCVHLHFVPSLGCVAWSVHPFPAWSGPDDERGAVGVKESVSFPCRLCWCQKSLCPFLASDNFFFVGSEWLCLVF